MFASLVPFARISSPAPTAAPRAPVRKERRVLYKQKLVKSRASGGYDAEGARERNPLATTQFLHDANSEAGRKRAKGMRLDETLKKLATL